MRVLHVVPNMQAGGIETFLMNVYRNIDREKVQFDFLVHYKKRNFYDDEIEKLGGRIYRLSVREDYNFIKYIYDLNTFFKEHHEYKIVHGHMMSLAYIYLGIAKKYGVPIRISHSHGDSALKNVKGKIKWLLFKFAKINANYHFACSRQAGEYLYGKNKFEIIKYPIDTNKFIFNQDIRNQVRKKYFCDDKLVIGNVARFNLQKNHTFIVKVFAIVLKNCPNAELWLIGKGETENSIKKLVNTLGIEDHVRFLGVRKDVERYYQGMDIFLFPSLFEGLGIVNIEVQASDLDEIMTDTIPEEAFITERAHPMSLSLGEDRWADEIVKIISNKAERKNRYQDIVDSGFDISNTVNKLEKFYLTVAAD